MKESTQNLIVRGKAKLDLELQFAKSIPSEQRRLLRRVIE